MANKGVIVTLTDTGPSSPTAAKSNDISSVQQRLYSDIQRTKAELAEAKSRLHEHPYRYGQQVMELENRLVRQARQYQELGALKPSDEYKWSSGQAFGHGGPDKVYK